MFCHFQRADSVIKIKSAINTKPKGLKPLPCPWVGVVWHGMAWYYTLHSLTKIAGIRFGLVQFGFYDYCKT